MLRRLLWLLALPDEPSRLARWTMRILPCRPRLTRKFHDHTWCASKRTPALAPPSRQGAAKKQLDQFMAQEF